MHMATQAAVAANDRPIMRIRDRAEFRSKPRPLTMRAETTVADAVAEMSRRSYGSVVVTDADERVQGIVTERDVMTKMVHERRDAATTPLSEIMTAEPRVASADDDVLDWLRIMSNERFRRLPVVDSDGRVTAVFTQGDFVSYTWPDLMGQARELAKATVFRNWHFFLIGGGLMVYTIVMAIVLGTV
jgi:CBS domain-containing protein